MCGIAGILSNSKFKVEIPLLRKMTDSIEHRGPDGQGQWTDSEQRIGLGHRRLSIIDLTENGAQPMHYMERYSITYNGEIYNYIELKRDLVNKGYKFRSDSDTEVLLACYDLYRESCLQYFDGMFAFAIWDNLEKTLFCARDRFGEKPFYYHIDKENTFYFASEMKAIWAAGIQKSINGNMMFLYLAHDIVENPQLKSETFYQEIYKLEAAHYLLIKDGRIDKKSYWNLQISESNSHLTEKQITDRFRELLMHSVSSRMRSDVSIGSSLSGGLDSSSIVTIINQFVKEGKQHCFSARYENYSKDEGIFIEKVTNSLNVHQHNAWNKSDTLVEILDRIIYHQEEPFQTGSIVAQWSVYKKAREENVVVVIDGQGADEFLCGYHYDFASFLREKLIASYSDYSYHYHLLNHRHSYENKLNLDFLFQTYFPNLKDTISDRTRKYRNVDYKSYLERDFYSNYEEHNKPFKHFNSLKEVLRYELMNYGLEKLLRFADRNAMAHGVEVRLPFLSHELIEFVFTLPSDIFLKDGWSKYILRKSMDGLLNPEICWRTDKIGFESPDNTWLKEKNIMSKIVGGKEKLLANGIVKKRSEIPAWKAIMMDSFIN